MIRSIATAFVRISDVINIVAKFALGALLVGMTMATFAQVLVRFVFTSFGITISAPWTEELSRYAMIWLVFVGLGVGFRYDMLISLTAVVNKVSARMRNFLRYLAFAASFGFLALIFSLGLEFVEFGRIERSPALSISKTWVYWAMPVGALIGCINILARVADAWLRGAEISSPITSDVLED
ncbi:TRAP transporter small permease [Celeribacter sp.]|uniref:TRAP transporter small permease n=1 Tax=Celeribacter sp. TaxID=1890673 RepID=UPI003A8EA0A1